MLTVFQTLMKMKAEVVQDIHKYITCSLLDKYAYSELHDLVINVHSHDHTTTYHKKKIIHVDLVHLDQLHQKL